VYGTLIRGVQPHIAKLRKNHKEGLAQSLEKQIEDILAAINNFPATLTVKEQALFALGYYHQRASDRARAKEISKKKLLGSEAARLGVEQFAVENDAELETTNSNMGDDE
jgi:CRISPR-associated protein Csd1